MRTRIVGAICRKELLESLRDRRTLFMMLALPILFYPLLLLLISQVATVQITRLEAQDSRVGVIGLQPEDSLLEALDRTPQLSVRLMEDINLRAADVILEVNDWPGELPADESLRLTLHFDGVSERALVALERVESVLDELNQRELERRLQAQGLHESWLEPLHLLEVNHATPETSGGMLLGSLLPIVVLLTILMGAYYPAIDLSAGEKERGTIQTLFTAPITRGEIVLGKYLAVVGIATLSGSANLLGMLLVFRQNLLPSTAERELDLSFSPGLETLLAIAWVILIVALLFSAILMGVAVLASSFKEAQALTTPVYLVCIIPALIAQLPGFHYSPTLAFVPGVSAIVLMKHFFLHGVQAGPLILVSLTTLAWTALALLIASRLFGNESVILGERGALHLLPRRRDFKPRPAPTALFATGWASILFLILFYLGAPLQGWNLQAGLFLTLWALLLAPTLGIAHWAKFDFRTTFRLHVPSGPHLAASLLLGVGSIIVINALNSLIGEWFLPVPTELMEAIQSLFPKPQGPWDHLIAFAVIALSPAIVEELIFRGFLLSGLRSTLSDRAVITLTAIAFGIFHLSIHRFFGTAMLGVVLAFVTLRSGSILPAMLIHLLNNSSALLLMELQRDGEPLHFPGAVVVVGTALTFFALSIFQRLRAPAAERRSTPPVLPAEDDFFSSR